MGVRRFLKRADKAFGTNGYKRKTVKPRKISGIKFLSSSDDDCGGEN